MAFIEEKRNVVSKQYGGTGGVHWDDGLFHGVREITVCGSTNINSITVQYYRNGEHITAAWHGGNHDDPKQIILGPDEFLKNVSGYVGNVGPNLIRIIRSLKFQSNIKTYGPYGKEEGDPFTFTVNEGDRIIGFFGRVGDNLDAIGFHVARYP